MVGMRHAEVSIASLNSRYPHQRPWFGLTADSEMRLGAPHFARDDLPSIDHRAAVANSHGDRCGRALYDALAEHLRDVLWDRLPWLRDDPAGEADQNTVELH